MAAPIGFGFEPAAQAPNSYPIPPLPAYMPQAGMDIQPYAAYPQAQPYQYQQHTGTEYPQAYPQPPPYGTTDYGASHAAEYPQYPPQAGADYQPYGTNPQEQYYPPDSHDPQTYNGRPGQQNGIPGGKAGVIGGAVAIGVGTALATQLLPKKLKKNKLVKYGLPIAGAGAGGYALNQMNNRHK